VSEFEAQFNRIKTSQGFIAALDQSGGSTPKALGLYGVDSSAWKDDAGMFSVVHKMRSRIMTTASFNGDRVLGAILFADTMNREVEGQPTADYLWRVKNVVPFLKVDQGMADEVDGVQLMRPMPELDLMLTQAKSKGIFGTKMRSLIKQPNAAGINAIVKQQFAVGRQIIAAGLLPIIEPEVDIHSPAKQEAETMLLAALMSEIDSLRSSEHVMLKLTLPESDNLYRPCIDHERVLKVVALSGGYPREEANTRLGRNQGMIASFSRALAEGLSVSQSDAEFDAMVDSSVDSIYQASCS